ncbi:MAG: glutamate--tRNA ligase [Pseudomonadota bacterium]
MTSNVVTRFAPSPTGFLHIGGARTALFNWLFARGRGGKFLLRIEDTDRARHNEEAVGAILNGLSWLGLDWDEEPVSQFANADRHREIVEQLVQKGFAYRCYMSPSDIEEKRGQARADGIRFESPWRNASPNDWPQNKQFAIRFKAPIDGETIFEDAVQGRMTFPNSALDDLVILRSTGTTDIGESVEQKPTPTYNLAVVVDDHDMGITHVVRGDDHLSNAARQKQIYDALGWPTPLFAHVPLIHGADGTKLSKRHGDLGVEAYRDQGFLPEGLANYLLRLGWSHGDDEFIPKEDALRWFDLKGINKAPARLDLDKMRSLNALHLNALPDNKFQEIMFAWLEGNGITLTEDTRQRLGRAAGTLKERCTTLADLPTMTAYILNRRPLKIEGKAAKPLKKDGAVERLRVLRDMLMDIDGTPDLWNANKLAEKLKVHAEQLDVGFGVIGQPLRTALTGGLPSPNLGDVLEILGKSETIGRINDAID